VSKCDKATTATSASGVCSGPTHCCWATRPVTDRSTYTQIHMPAPSNYTHRQTCSDSHSWWATRPVTDRSTHTQIHTPAPSNYTHRHTDREELQSLTYTVTVTAGEPLDQSQTDPPTHRYTRQHQAIIHTDTQTDRSRSHWHTQWQSQLVSYKTSHRPIHLHRYTHQHPAIIHTYTQTNRQELQSLT